MPHRTPQLSLDLRPTPRWGGRRAGAERKPGPVRKDPHRRRPTFRRATPFHVTLKLRPGLPSLRSARFLRAFESTMRTGCERGRFRVVRAVQRVFGLRRGRGKMLRDRFHLHVLRSPREVRRAIAYVLLNARRHAAQRGVAVGRMLARVDAGSSGRWFDGWKRAGLQPDRPAEGPAVARARSWLLAVEWRRVGLVDVAEIPGGRHVRCRPHR